MADRERVGDDRLRTLRPSDIYKSRPTTEFSKDRGPEGAIRADAIPIE